LLYLSKLYFILDIDTVLSSPLEIVRKLLRKAVIDIIQLRAKSIPKREIFTLANNIKKLLKKSKVLFIINDYIDIANLVDADGLHLGQNDLPLPLAKRILGKEKLIGITCHSLEEAREAEKEGADYISIGPIFKTPLKPETKALGIDILKNFSRHISIPYFCIGGINLSNIDRLLSLNVERFAFSRLIGKAKNIDFVIQQLEKKILF
jgi:thiamine-phosphate pyrophosphorylase